ncbi:Carbon-nitrogen hydrolase [Rhizina undulata]
MSGNPKNIAECKGEIDSSEDLSELRFLLVENYNYIDCSCLQWWAREFLELSDCCCDFRFFIDKRLSTMDPQYPRLVYPIRRSITTTPSIAKMTLAACGQFAATNVLSHNLKACQILVQKAVSAGAKALFLPEASDYLSRTPEETLDLCLPVTSSPFVRGLQEEARRHSLPINVGIHEPTEDGKKERVKNTTIWIDEQGNITNRYQKIHTFDVDIEGGPKLMESRTTEPGSFIGSPIQTPLGKLGMLICFDLRFPEASATLVQRGAELISYPSAFTIPTGQAHWEILLRARAIETQSYVLAAAQYGRHNEKRASYGHSMIIDPWGRILGECSKVSPGEEPKEAADVEPEICLGELDLDLLKKVRREVPLKRLLFIRL